MATTKKRLTARIAAGFGAAAIATLSVLGGALPASAAPDNIDPAARGSITIHKFEEPVTASGLARNGTEVLDTGSLTAIPNVEVSLQRVVGIDLSTNAGWQQAAALTAQAPGQLTAVGTRTTGADGIAKFEQLPLGVYLVTETVRTDDDIAIAGAPFLVTVPTPVDNTWLYDVHVYPKSSTSSITKQVDDSAARGLGSEVTWTISVDVPEVGQYPLTELRIEDTMDSRLDFVDATLSASQAGATATAPRVPVNLVFNTDYLVSEGPDYQISFTAAGLTKLAALNEGSIDIVVTTAVARLGDGIIENTASLLVNGKRFDSETVTTEWGSLEILKHETGDQTAVLGGAQFQVFASAADAAARVNPVVVSNATTFTSDATTGIASVPGLIAGTYWVVETAAPVGYVIDQTPREVVVAAGDVDATVELSIANAQVPAYALPITGGAGQAAFMVGGAGLILGGLGFVLLRRRKTQAQNQA